MGDFGKLLRGTLRASFVLLCHLVLVTVILSVIRAVEFVIHYLWGTADPLLFDSFPLRYLFHGMDLAVILNFAWYSSVSAARAFRESAE